MLLYVIGSSQDGGYPHPGCKDDCCSQPQHNKELVRYPSCIALIDQLSSSYWLLDITPEYKEQIKYLDLFNCSLKGVFITHAHVGHYNGLINFFPVNRNFSGSFDS